MDTEKVTYTPTDVDLAHMDEIRAFLSEESIPYVEDSETFGVFHLNDGKLQLRYVDSYYYPMDNSKRFGEKCRGVKHSYFIDISHDNLYNKDIRTVWCFDFEMEQSSDIVDEYGHEVKGYRRQWEVIKNTLRTACGRIRTRIYARDCEVREIPKADVRPFLERNCFYGYRSASVNLGLYLKKDKNGIKAGTLLMLYSFGYNYYGNKNRADDPLIEIIRVSTVIGCQVIGGASKCLKHFLEDYDTLRIGDKDVKVNELRFYVDASHNDGRAMKAMGFNFISWEGCGFQNRWCCDYDGAKDETEPNALKGRKGEIFQRKPQFHKTIMRLIGENKIVSIANAGTSVYSIKKDEYLASLGVTPQAPKPGCVNLMD